MSAPKPIELPTPEELGCQDVGVTLASRIGALCDVGEGISDEVLSKVCSVNAMRWNGSTWVKEADMAHRVAVPSYNPQTQAMFPVGSPVPAKQPITEESIHRMMLKIALQCYGGPGGGKYGKYFRRFWADALNRILDEAMRKGVVSEEYDVRDDWEP